MKAQRYPLTIIYKNGAKVHATVEEFKFSIRGGTRDFEWKNMDPRPLWMNVDEVYAVYEGRA